MRKPALAAMFSDDRRYWPFAAGVFAILSLMKGLRLPNRWCATAALIDYSHGFVKRGLFGATLGRWAHVERYTHFVVLSYTLMLVMVAMLGGLILRSGVWRLGAGEPVAVFAASFAVTYFGHLVGYTDIVLAILTIALLLVRNTVLRGLLAVPACVVALLVHEMFLLVFLPVVLLTFVVDSVRDRSGRAGAYRAIAGLLLAMCLGVASKLALKAPASVTAADSLYQYLRSRADFPLRDDFFLVLSRSTAVNLKIMIYLWHQSSYRKAAGLSFLTLLPTMGLLLCAVRRAADGCAQGQARALVVAGAFVAALSPLTMNALAWDVERFNALVCLDCLLVLLVLCRKAGGSAIALPPWYRNAAILAVAASMASGAGLMDGETIRPYPFSSSVAGAVKGVLHHHWDPPAH